MRIYLAHPITTSNEWIVEAVANVKRSLVDLGFEVVDPSDFGLSEDEAGAIITKCKYEIDKADIVVALCLCPSWGTAMEIFYASDNKEKTVLALVDKGFNSSWINFHSRKFESSERLIGFLCGLRVKK